MKLTLMPTAAVVLMAATLAGCASTPPGPRAAAKLDAKSDSAVRGIVSFTTQEDGSLKVFVDATGLIPGEHGFHVHEVGDCRAPDASSAKGHFNPGGKAHGFHAGPERHAGDMPNIAADNYGTVRTTFVVTGLSLSGENTIVGRSVIVHADPDDYKSQPAGNSGKRIACGVISLI